MNLTFIFHRLVQSPLTGMAISVCLSKLEVDDFTQDIIKRSINFVN